MYYKTWNDSRSDRWYEIAGRLTHECAGIPSPGDTECVSSVVSGEVPHLGLLGELMGKKTTIDVRQSLFFCCFFVLFSKFTLQVQENNGETTWQCLNIVLFLNGHMTGLEVLIHCPSVNSGEPCCSRLHSVWKL